MTAQARTTTDLPLVAFTTELGADLTGLSVSQLRRWDRTGFFQPWRVNPNRRRAYSRIYSLPDVIALRAIAELREAGASFVEVKRHRNLLEPGEIGDWPAPSFHVVGTRLFASRDEALAVLHEKSGQDEPVLINLDEVAARVEQRVRKLAERRPEEIGQITRNRWIMQGVPIIAGTRIPTETIAWFHDNGYALDGILKNFPRLTPEDVRAAIAFEKGPTQRPANSRWRNGSCRHPVGAPVAISFLIDEHLPVWNIRPLLEAPNPTAVLPSTCRGG